MPSSIDSGDETYHDAFFVHTCVEEVEHAVISMPEKPMFSMGKEEPLENGLDRRTKQSEYL